MEACLRRSGIDRCLRRIAHAVRLAVHRAGRRDLLRRAHPQVRLPDSRHSARRRCRSSNGTCTACCSCPGWATPTCATRMCASTSSPATCPARSRPGSSCSAVSVFALPYCWWRCTYCSWSFVVVSFLQDESSDAPNGLPTRWVIKGLPVPRPGRCSLPRSLSVLLRSSSACSARPIWPRAPARRPRAAGALRGRDHGMDWSTTSRSSCSSCSRSSCSWAIRSPSCWAAIALGFGVLGIVFDVFQPAQFGNLLPRIYGQAVQNQVLIAVPMFIFMGTMLEKSASPTNCCRRCRC